MAGHQTPLYIALGLVLLTAVAPGSAAQFEGGPGTDLPIVHEKTYDGGTALGLRFDLSDASTFRVDMVGHGPRQTTPVANAALFFNEDRTYRSGIFVTAFDSIDRQVAHVDGIPADDQDEAADGTQIGPVSTFSEGEAVQTAGEAPPKKCPLFCSVLLQQEDRTHAGSFYYILWLGGTHHVDVRVFAGDAVETVAIEEGTPHVFGDASLEGGTVNVQHQSTHATPLGPASTGAKVLLGAHQDRVIEDELWAYWSLYGEKEVCQFGLLPFSCASTIVAKRECTNLAPVTCEHARISWEGPESSGSTSTGTFLYGEPAGDYTFTVDRKIDGWTSPIVIPDTGVEVRPFEHHTALSAADVSLPPAPP